MPIKYIHVKVGMCQYVYLVLVVNNQFLIFLLEYFSMVRILSFDRK